MLSTILTPQPPLRIGSIHRDVFGCLSVDTFDKFIDFVSLKTLCEVPPLPSHDRDRGRKLWRWSKHPAKGLSLFPLKRARIIPELIDELWSSAGMIEEGYPPMLKVMKPALRWEVRILPPPRPLAPVISA